jgi:glutathione S-transferase
MPHLKLTYFPIAGRSFPARASLTLKKIPFEFEQIPFEDWFGKQPGANRDRFPLGNIPVLYVDGKPLCESIAINQYVGQLTGLWPTDPLEAARALEILLVMEIVWTGAPEGPDDHHFSSTMSMPEEAKKAAREGAITKRIQYNYAYIEKIIGTDGFAVGGKLSIVDFALAQFVGAIKSGHFDYLTAEATVAPFPNLLRLTERFFGDAEIAHIVGPLLA